MHLQEAVFQMKDRMMGSIQNYDSYINMPY
jgi:hypothetical protein